MRDLLDDVNSYLSDNGRALTVAAYLHASLVDIHPNESLVGEPKPSEAHDGTGPWPMHP